MFYERADSHMLDSRMGFLNDAGYEDMCISSGLKEDPWHKVQNLLPTPPCSPEELCYQSFHEFLPPPPSTAQNFQQGLQVVPDEMSEDLVDTELDSLPVLDISDEEMQKLTSPTIFDHDTIWQLHGGAQPQQQQAATGPQCEVYDNMPTTVSDVNHISHGIRNVYISDQVVRSPAYSQSFVLTVNANPIQPLNTMGHLITREILATPANSGMISDQNFMNERVNLVGPFDLANLQSLPDSPTKRGGGRKIRRSISHTQDTVQPEETADDSEDSETTRATHNVLERRRREELKEKFQRLRDCLPELQDNDRAPKVLILKKSSEYVQYLEQEEQRLLADKELEKQRLLILLKKRHLLAQTFLPMQC